jgi:hypothetical protein
MGTCCRLLPHPEHPAPAGCHLCCNPRLAHTTEPGRTVRGAARLLLRRQSPGENATHIQVTLAENTRRCVGHIGRARKAPLIQWEENTQLRKKPPPTGEASGSRRVFPEKTGQFSGCLTRGAPRPAGAASPKAPRRVVRSESGAVSAVAGSSRPSSRSRVS